MDFKKNELNELEEARDKILPQTKFWNQNSLFLVFGASFAIISMSGMELFKTLARDYAFKIDISKLFSDGYFIGILLFFIFGLAICITAARIIDRNTKDSATTLKSIKDEIKLKK